MRCSRGRSGPTPYCHCTVGGGVRVVTVLALCAGLLRGSNGFIHPGGTPVTNCSVVIAGGSTSALAAAVASALEGVSTCLLEPTDWVGGQLTSAGDPAIDFNQAPPITDGSGVVVDVNAASHYPGNHGPAFFELLRSINTTGRCSVSTNCFLPKTMLSAGIATLLARPGIAKNLRVYYRTVLVGAAATVDDPTTVGTVQVVQRIPTASARCDGWDSPLSASVTDWYSPHPSARFDKRVLDFTGASPTRPPVFVEATEWGDLLALLDAPYLQGVSERYDGDVSRQGNDQCGQAFSVTLTATLHATDQNETDVFPTMPESEYEANCNSPASCDFIWSRRRLYSANQTAVAAPGDVTLFVVQDWRWSYMFKSMADARADAKAGAWVGGLNLSVVQVAEAEALGWYGWLKSHASYGRKLTLRDTADRQSNSPFGTCTGLTKMPYIRDSRRTIGIGNFVLNASTIRHNHNISLAVQPVGLPWPDRCATITFQIDVHEMHDYQSGGRKCYPDYISGGKFVAYMNDRDILPFSIPLRALTNSQFDKNLVMAGKTIATSFMVSSATRLHPGEWATGSAAGAAAAVLATTSASVADMVEPGSPTMHAVLTAATRHTPRDWILNCTANQPRRAGDGWACFNGTR